MAVPTETVPAETESSCGKGPYNYATSNTSVRFFPWNIKISVILNLVRKLCTALVCVGAEDVNAPRTWTNPLFKRPLLLFKEVKRAHYESQRSLLTCQNSPFKAVHSLLNDFSIIIENSLPQMHLRSINFLVTLRTKSFNTNLAFPTGTWKYLAFFQLNAIFIIK